MLQLVRLYLPALIPSWRFFKEIAPSPRIDVQQDGGEWREYSELPERLTVAQTLARLVWNPAWTEHLFLVSCAERMIETPSDHSLREIQTRLTRILAPKPEAVLRFRLRFVCREDDRIVSYIDYESPEWRAHEL